ncbi:MAG TPA: hypothetical protein QF762_08140 [Acidimicrobiales bacterium]|nr:hypothetical protein [Acidimicrobiales bacterium]
MLVNSQIYKDTLPAPGPVVLVDIDGVLSDASGRQHYLFGENKEWWNFFEAAIDDPPIVESIQLVNRLAQNHTVILLTARPKRLTEITVNWMSQNNIRWEALEMRPDDDNYTSSPDVKRKILHSLQSLGYQPKLAIDDDPRNLVMYQTEGIPTVYIHSGYYE